MNKKKPKPAKPDLLMAATANGGGLNNFGDGPIEPEDGDRKIPSGWTDAQLGHFVRDITGKHWVVTFWVYGGDLWCRPQPPQ